MENKPSTQDEYVQAIKATFIKLGLKVIAQKTIAMGGFMALAPVQTVVAWVAEKILEIVVDETETGIFFLYIDMRVHAQGREFSHAAVANFKAQQSGTKEEKDATEKTLIIAFIKLVKFTN